MTSKHQILCPSRRRGCLLPAGSRFRSSKEFIGDAIYDLSRPLPAQFTIVDPLDLTRRRHIPLDVASEDLLVPIFRGGRLVYECANLEQIRQRAQHQLNLFHPGIKRFINPHQYPAGLELGLHDLKTKLILQARDDQR